MIIIQTKIGVIYLDVNDYILRNFTYLPLLSYCISAIPYLILNLPWSRKFLVDHHSGLEHPFVR